MKPGGLRIVALAAAFVALATVPLWTSGTYYINVSSQILFYAIFAMGLNILVGYAGLVSLGHAGMFGITAYALAYLLSAGLGHTTAILGAFVISMGCMAVYAALALRTTGIGFIYNFGQALLPELAYFVLFLPMLLVLVFRPQGLFGRPIQ
jgi:branched-chain amino acid transport system permease protein